jgi:hypothetical protein
MRFHQSSAFLRTCWSSVEIISGSSENIVTGRHLPLYVLRGHPATHEAYRCLRASGPVKPTPVTRCGWLGPPQPGVRGATPQTPRAAPHRTEMRGSRGHPSNPRTQGHPGSSPEAKPLSLPPHSYLRGRSLLQLEWREKGRGVWLGLIN